MKAHSKICAALAATAAFVVPAAAHASTLSLDGSGTLHYQAGPGEKNQPSFQESNGNLVILEADGIPWTDNTGQCEVDQYLSYQITCPMPSAIYADMGDRDDYGGEAGDFPANIPLAMVGGDGKDRMTASTQENHVTFDGGPGDDEIKGTEVSDTLTGGAGNDLIEARGGSDNINGGDGNDELVDDGYNVDPAPDVVDGGPGIDKIDSQYTDPTDDAPPMLNFTLGGGADDGRPGEGDDIRNVEQLYVYGPGTYTGSEGPDDIQVRNITANSTLRGNGGNDNLKAGDGEDELDGGAGDDTLDGGFNDDHIVGGPGRDRIHGDTPAGECGIYYCRLSYGNDTIDARDGEVDSIDCSVGQDVVNADANDVVAADCETVNRGPAVNDDDNNVNHGPAAGRCVVPKVKGMKQKAASRKIKKAGCSVKVKKAKSRTVARGRVIKASRKAGARVARGTKVTITVSRGRR